MFLNQSGTTRAAKEGAAKGVGLWGLHRWPLILHSRPFSPYAKLYLVRGAVQSGQGRNQRAGNPAFHEGTRPSFPIEFPMYDQLNYLHYALINTDSGRREPWSILESRSHSKAFAGGRRGPMGLAVTRQISSGWESRLQLRSVSEAPYWALLA